MNGRRERTTKRNHQIKSEYYNLRCADEKGVVMYTHKYAVEKIADDFYLSPRTIEKIVFNRS